jgi:transposase-like protein
MAITRPTKTWLLISYHRKVAAAKRFCAHPNRLEYPAANLVDGNAVNFWASSKFSPIGHAASTTLN